MSQPDDADVNEILFPAHAAGHTREQREATSYELPNVRYVKYVGFLT